MNIRITGVLPYETTHLLLLLNYSTLKQLSSDAKPRPKGDRQERSMLYLLLLISMADPQSHNLVGQLYNYIIKYSSKLCTKILKDVAKDVT